MITCPECKHPIVEHTKVCIHYDVINPATWDFCQCKQSAQDIAQDAIATARREAGLEAIQQCQIISNSIGIFESGPVFQCIGAIKYAFRDVLNSDLSAQPVSIQMAVVFGEADLEPLALPEPAKGPKVIVAKSFAEKWTDDPQHYKDYYGTEDVEVKR